MELAIDAAKWNYLVSGLALLAVLVIDPVTGLVGYIAAHALEYVIVVQQTLRARYKAGTGTHKGILPALAATPTRRAGLLLGFFAVFAVVDLELQGVIAPEAYLIIGYSIGLLHFLYDAFIWKSRKPAVAADFGIPPQTST